MNTNLEPINGEEKKTPLLKKIFTISFWQKENNWLLLLTLLLLSTVIIYLSVHSLEQFNSDAPHEYYDEPHEAEYKKMDEADIAYLTSLINVGSTSIPTPGQNIENIIDSTNSKSITIENKATFAGIRFKNNPNCRVVKDFIVSQLPYVYPQDTVKIFNLLDEQPNSLAVAYIQNTRFRVKSYFWLAGPHTYLEVIFWTIFGVIASILFYISAAIANGIGFRAQESPGHLAKIVYAPFISLIIIFSYNVISNPDSFIDVNASKGTLIISFLLGFYSSRAMKLLDKIKDVVLPYGDQTSADDKREAEESDAAAANNTGLAVSVDLTINDPAHSDQEVLQGHIAQAQVTLSPTNGTGEPITLEQNSEDELSSTFIAPTVPAGEYTLTASLSTADGENYEATEPATVNEEDTTFNLTLTKTEVSG